MANILMGKDNKNHDAYIIIGTYDEKHVDIYTAGVDNGAVGRIDIDELIETLESMRKSIKG